MNFFCYPLPEGKPFVLKLKLKIKRLCIYVSWYNDWIIWQTCDRIIVVFFRIKWEKMEIVALTKYITDVPFQHCFNLESYLADKKNVAGRSSKL